MKDIWEWWYPAITYRSSRAYDADRAPEESKLIWEMDQRCQRGNRPAHTILARAQTQGSSMKDPSVQEAKFKPRKQSRQLFSVPIMLGPPKKHERRKNNSVREDRDAAEN